MDLLEKFPPPWTWVYHPDNRLPIALTGRDPGGDVLLATGDDRSSYMIADEEVLRALAALPELLAACRLALSVGECLDNPDDENQRIYIGKRTIGAIRAAIAMATGAQ